MQRLSLRRLSLGGVVPHVQILMAALLFSTGGMGVKSCGLPEAQIASFRCGIAALVLALCLPWLRAANPGTSSRQGAKRPWTWLHGAVGFCYAATLVGFVLANKSTTASNAIFLQSTAPIYIFFLAPWWLSERQRRSDLFVMLSLVVGMGLLLSGDVQSTAVAPAPLRGNLLAAFCGLAWATTLMGLRGLSAVQKTAKEVAGETAGETAGEGALQAVIAGNVLGFVLVLPWTFPWTAAPLGDWLWLLYLGILQVGLAYLLLTRGLRRVTAFEAAVLLLAEPLFNPIWAYIVHGEIPQGLALVGALIILFVTVARPFLERRPTEAQAHG